MRHLLLLALPFVLSAGDFRVASYKLLTAQGGRVSWSAKLNVIAFDRLGTNGFYDVYSMLPDGSSIKCITCGSTVLPPYNRGNPDWHPSGQFLALQAQWGGSGKFTQPGDGANNDLWLMNAAGTQYWQVTHQVPGILHPHFSHDGTKLMWSQHTTGRAWAIMLGDVSISNNVPSVTNIQAIPPCASGVFCESHGFSRDDSTMFFSGTLNGQNESGLDIYSYNISSRTVTNLTNTPSSWDEHARPMPNADKLVWMSGILGSGGLHTEFWMMDLDGSNKNKLTWYNDSRSPSYVGGVSVSDSDWSPDGTQFVAYFIPQGNSNGLSNSIYLITLEPSSTSVSTASYARVPMAPDSIVSTFGTGLSSVQLSAANSLSTNLGGSTVQVTDARGTTRGGEFFFVSPNQVNWSVPSGTAPGPATVAITNAAGQQLRGTVDVEAISPALFTANSSGSGAAAAYVETYHSGSTALPITQFTFNCSAGAGSCQPASVRLGTGSDQTYLILFGTGILHHSSVVTAQVGSQSLPVSFASAQGTFTGLDQINILLPASMAGSGLVNVVVAVDGVDTNPVQLQIQ